MSARVVGAAAAAVLLAGVGVVALQGSDRSTPYDPGRAIADFRASPAPSASTAPSPTPSARAPVTVSRTPAAAPTVTVRATASAAAAPRSASASAVAARREPEPGVYTYATAGFERVDALGGARHDYPDTSTITYRRRGCGTEERWQPLEERVGTTLTCEEAGGPALRETRQRREFFGQSQEQAFTCRGALVVPTDPRPGRTWRGTCRNDEAEVVLDGRVVALPTLEVDGRRVPVVHVRIAGTATGSVRGRLDRELWLSRETGLLVRAVGTTDTQADTPGGPVRYEERYELQLTSLEPQR